MCELEALAALQLPHVRTNPCAGRDLAPYRRGTLPALEATTRATSVHRASCGSTTASISARALDELCQAPSTPARAHAEPAYASFARHAARRPSGGPSVVSLPCFPNDRRRVDLVPRASGTRVKLRNPDVAAFRRSFPCTPRPLHPQWSVTPRRAVSAFETSIIVVDEVRATTPSPSAGVQDEIPYFARPHDATVARRRAAVAFAAAK